MRKLCELNPKCTAKEPHHSSGWARLGDAPAPGSIKQIAKEILIQNLSNVISKEPLQQSCCSLESLLFLGAANEICLRDAIGGHQGLTDFVVTHADKLNMSLSGCS